MANNFRRFLTALGANFLAASAMSLPIGISAENLDIAAGKAAEAIAAGINRPGS
jgi:hypothetical protein